MRVVLSVLGVVALVLGVPVAWNPPVPIALAQGNTIAAPDETVVGVIVDTTNPRSMSMAREGGFTHAKMIVHWPRLEPNRGRYTFAETSENDLDNVMRAARDGDMKLVVRVDGAPDWAGGKPSKADPKAVEAFYAAMAAHGRGTVTAYEILNEPNLPFEWGGSPSPSGYAAFVKAAYKGVKKGDPSALVIGGGLSPATGGAGGTVEDTDFLRGMYAAGVKGSMDALAIHNYGGNHEPEREPGDCGICFRRAEIYRQLMVEQGDAATPIWATEFGWLLDNGKNMGQYDWMRVSADKQADYVVRSYKYAQKNWPWMTGLLLSNLDASTSPYHTGPQDGMPWFAILNKDHSPRPAWKAFKAWREDERSQAASRPRASANTGTGTNAGVGMQAQQPPPSPAPIPPAPDPAGSTAQPAVAQAAGSSAAAEPSTTPVPANASGMTAAEPGVVAVAEAATPTPPPAPPVPTATPTAAPPSTSPPASPPAAPPAPSSLPASATRLRVAKTGGTGANLRSRPTSSAPVVAILMDGTTVDVVGEDVQAEGRSWRQVRTVGSTTDGVTGWVAAQYLQP